MDLRHLRYFLAVAEYGTVTAAALHCHVAQPAVSRQLHRLEQDLGITIFTRHGPRLALTEAGRAFIPVASEIVNRADQATIFARQMAEGSPIRLVVAAASTTIDYVLAPFVAELAPDAPFLAAELVAADAVHDAVRSGLDIGVSATLPPVDSLAWRALTEVPLRAYVHPGHAWDGRESVTLDELVEEPLIVPLVSNPTRMRFDRALAAAGLRFSRHEVVEAAPLRIALAKSGRGVAIATDLVRFGARPVFVHDSEDNPIRLSIHACWNPAHYAAKAIHDIVEELAEFSEDHVRTSAERISTVG